jgi:hypothetical protein
MTAIIYFGEMLVATFQPQARRPRKLCGGTIARFNTLLRSPVRGLSGLRRIFEAMPSGFDLSFGSPKATSPCLSGGSRVFGYVEADNSAGSAMQDT